MEPSFWSGSGKEETELSSVRRAKFQVGAERISREASYHSGYCLIYIPAFNTLIEPEPVPCAVYSLSTWAIIIFPEPD